MLGDITQKGYEKKKLRLLAPYITQAQQQSGMCLIYIDNRMLKVFIFKRLFENRRC